MENFFLKIKDIVFRLNLDAEIALQMLERVPSLCNSMSQSSYNIDVICTKVENMIFTDNKFLNQQEPDINDTCYYREIFDLGIFKYLRKEKLLKIAYLDIDKYPFNSFEVVVDTILQFIYLIMLEFEIVPLHAAVLAYKKRAVLLFGNSGSGKTTLELSLLNSGFLFFSDDIAFLDEGNLIYNSGERIIACSKTSEEIIHKCFAKTFLDIENKNAVNKQIISINSTMASEHSELVPYMIVFPMPGICEELLKKIPAKSAFIELIKLTISAQFSSEQKQLYMKRLKNLSENTQTFQYFWTSQKNDLKEICHNIREICEQGGEFL